MKQQNFLKSLILILTTVAFFSCSSSDDDGGGNQVTSITISTGSNSIELGESFTFLVKDNNNSNVSSQSTIYVNGSAISGTFYTPVSEGTYSVKAKLGNITSVTINLTVTGPSLSVIVASVDNDVTLLGGRFVFSALGNGGVDLTTDATYSINGTAITGNEYTSTERGSFVMTASYGGVTSNEVDLVVGYVQKVLVEDYTGAWCGYCPRLAYNLEQAETQNDNVIGVAVHNGDVMAYEYEALMRAQFNFEGWPTGMINRTILWNESVVQVLSYTGVNGDLGLGLETSLSGTTISVDVKVAYINTVNDAKVIVYLLEDGLLYDQVNYMNNNSSSPWYQTGNPIPNFIHNNVLRKAFTNILGDAIPNAVDGDEYTDTFTLSVPASVQDTSKLQIVAFVVDDTGKAINAQRVDLGDSHDYE